jgi:hypothetical protein
VANRLDTSPRYRSRVGPENLPGRIGFGSGHPRTAPSQSLRFVNRLDPFFGNLNDPLSLHKYVYAVGDPVGYVDPTGCEFNYVSLGITMAIGATIGGASTMVANYALGQPLTQGLGVGIAFGTVAAPLAVAVPVLGVALAGYGILQTWSILWTVAVNPRSTNGQVTAALVLFGASLFGGYAAGKNLYTNGWYNPIFERPPAIAEPGLTPATPLQEMFPQIGDDTMVHLSRAPVSELAEGVKVSQGTGKSYWFRWGDVKHLTVTQLRSLVGDLAQSGLNDARTLAFKQIDPAAPSPFTPGATVLATFLEYVTSTEVVPDGAGTVVPK